MKLADFRFLRVLVLLAPALVACDPRFHLIGRLDAGIGSGGGDPPSDAGPPRSDGRVADGGAAADALPPSGALAIPPREALARVARVLWEAQPDAALVAMADSGAVTTTADVRRIARSMLTDARARAAVGHFYRWWLNLDALASVTKDPALFPTYSPAVGSMMAAETEAFGVHVTLDDDGRFPTLLQAPYSFVNQTLAGLYGVSGVTGNDLRKVSLDPTWRAGLFTQLAFQTKNSSETSWTSPTQRGLFVRMKMLCGEIPPPPPDVTVTLPDTPPDLTNRERLTQSFSSPACAGCHNLMDPIGFGYEVFDSIGRLRLTDHGKPIDASGNLQGSEPSTSFNGPVELAQRLAAAPDAHRCMSTQWLAYALGRSLPVDATLEPSISEILTQFQASGLDLRTLIAAAVSSPAFLAPDGGPACTPGLDQTCNDDPRISSLHGTCTAAGRCACNGNWALNPATGRCL